MRATKLFGIFSGGQSFDPITLQSKFAGWWKDETSGYVTDKINSQDRQALTQNSQAGQVFPGRAIQFASSSKYAYVQDSGALDIGTPPFTMAFWIYFDTFTGFSRFLPGKFTNGTTSGEYYFTTGSNSISFVCRSSGGLVTVSNLITSATSGVWYHIIVNINDDGKVYAYKDKTVVASNPTWTGTFGSLASTIGFGVNTITSVIASLSGYGAISIRDLRIFRANLTSQQRTDVYDGKYVAGFDQWWMMSDNGTTRLHSARNSGGQHLTTVGFSGSESITGFWRQMFNEYGYAENATYGQIPPDMTSLTGGVPTVDCRGNALVFYGSAKQHLVKSGTDFVMPSNALSVNDMTNTLELSCDVVGINQWYSSSVPQNVAVSATAPFCGSRQFYNATTKELIIIKEGQHLTASEEANLCSYMGLSSLSHTYHANTDALFARFTNTYGDKEKSRIDNVMRLLVRNSIYDKLEVFILAATSGLEEQLLDWISASNNLVPANPTSTQLVTQQPYRGYAGRNDCYKSTFNPSTATKFLQNDCFMAFKHSEALKVPFGGDNGGIIAGVYNAGVSNVYADIYSAGNAVRFFLNSNGSSGGYAYTSPVDSSRTFLGNRTASNLTKTYSQRQEVGSSSTVSAARPNSIVYYGGAKQIGANAPINGPALNWTQNIAYGGSLSATQAKLYTAIIDNFGDGQRVLITDDWIYDTGCKYKYSDKCFIDRFGDKVIWGDQYNLYYSEDGGTTVTGTISWNYSTLGWPHMAHIFDNGKIIFATNKNKIYKTTTANFSSYSEMIPTKNGSTYTIHTPGNALYPGEYYKFIGPKIKQYLGDGTEIFVWNNYGLSTRGAAPGVVWYSFGDEIKVAFEMGTNPYTRDNGGSGGGTTGTFLGDAAVNYWVRHGHGVQQQSNDLTKFISMWGDLDRNALSPALSSFYECQFFSHTYNQGSDTWSSSVIKQGTQSSRWKATAGQMPGDGYIYWTSDAGIVGGNEAERGYFKSLIANLGDGSETRFYNPLQARPSNMFHLDSSGFFMGGGYAATGGSAYGGFFGPTNIIWSSDMVNFNELNLKLPGNTYIFMIVKISSKRYMLNLMSDYDYFLGAQSVIIDFN